MLAMDSAKDLSCKRVADAVVSVLGTPVPMLRKQLVGRVGP